MILTDDIDKWAVNLRPHPQPTHTPSFPRTNELPLSYLSSDMNMGDQPGPSRLRAIFEAALRDYGSQTGIVLANHPLAEKLQNCNSVESVIAVLHEQTQDFSDFRGRDKVLKLLKNAVSVFHKLSSTADLGQAIGLVRPLAVIACFAFFDHIP